MKSLVNTILISLLISLSACTNSVSYQKTKLGLEYHFFEKKDTGRSGKPGDYYLLDMIGQREDDSVFLNSYTMGHQIKMVRTKPPYVSMFNDALGLLKIGDSVIFKMIADSFFRPLGQPIPKYLKKNEIIRFTLSVKDILNPQAHLLKMYESEYDRMEAYLNVKKWNFKTDTATGIKYEMIKAGNDLKAETGDIADISYLITYLDGKIIDRTKPGDKANFTVGSAEFAGLSRLILLASEGSKLQAIIPFSQAFGEQGSRYVDAYSTLVIELEIIKINKKQ
jgi:FKBP-type peptidyl-prolyl cis-trans isomerase FkpA